MGTKWKNFSWEVLILLCAMEVTEIKLVPSALISGMNRSEYDVPASPGKEECTITKISNTLHSCLFLIVLQFLFKLSNTIAGISLR